MPRLILFGKHEKLGPGFHVDSDQHTQAPQNVTSQNRKFIASILEIDKSDKTLGYLSSSNVSIVIIDK